MVISVKRTQALESDRFKGCTTNVLILDLLLKIGITHLSYGPVARTRYGHRNH